jgi:hypothetical protein
MRRCSKTPWPQGQIVISHDVNTLKAEAEQRIADGRGVAGVLLTAQNQPTRAIAENIVLIWAASESEEWRDCIIHSLLIDEKGGQFHSVATIRVIGRDPRGSK